MSPADKNLNETTNTYKPTTESHLQVLYYQLYSMHWLTIVLGKKICNALNIIRLITEVLFIHNWGALYIS
jgi:hypothetical protein